MGYIQEGVQVTVIALDCDRALIGQVGVSEWPRESDSDEDFGPGCVQFDTAREPGDWDRRWCEGVEQCTEPEMNFPVGGLRHQRMLGVDGDQASRSGP